MNPAHGSTLPKYFLSWSRRACVLRSRCLPLSSRSAPSSELFPLYVPANPTSRAKGCKPYSVALVPTLGCSRPLPASLLLHLIYPQIHYRDICFRSSRNGPYIRTCLVTPQEEKKHRVNHAHKHFCSCLHERPPARQESAGCLPRSAFVPTHPLVEIQGRNFPGRRAPKPHTNSVHTFVYCCYYCCMLLLRRLCCCC